MHTVWKYPFEVQDSFALLMPAGAQVLAVQVQGDQPVLWALADPAGPREYRSFVLAGTGHPLPGEPGRYIGTFQLLGGRFVGHLWEEPR
jgi:hypothetical protein